MTDISSRRIDLIIRTGLSVSDHAAVIIVRSKRSVLRIPIARLNSAFVYSMRNAGSFLVRKNRTIFALRAQHRCDVRSATR